MATKGKTQPSQKGPTQVVSFRIATDLYARLEEMAAGERDEMGVPLTAAGMARRMLMQAIERAPKAKK